MWIYVVIGLIIIISIYILIIYNSFVTLKNKQQEAFSTMDIYLKKRWDLIPNIVEIVKGYAKHEKTTLTEITALRNNSYDKLSNDEKITTNEELTKGITKLMALVENYPDLKADEHYQELSNQLVKVEDEIANSRKYYNGVIRLFNNKVEMFPSNIFARIFGYKSQKMFEANDQERENINIKL